MLINNLINAAKFEKMDVLERSINLLVHGLKSKNIPFIESEKDYTFSLNGSVIKEWYNVTDRYSFKELVKVSNSISEPLLNDQLDFIKYWRIYTIILYQILYQNLIIYLDLVLIIQ